MENTALTEAVTSIAIVAATLVVAHYADKAVIAGVKKIRPSMKPRKLFQVRP